MKNRIAALRRERKLSQAELAEALEVTRQTIISLENGRYNASLLLAYRLARYFGLTIEEVFLFEEEEAESAAPARREEKPRREAKRRREPETGPGGEALQPC